MKIIWLHEIVNPPMDQSGEEETCHDGEAHGCEKRTIPIKTIYPCEIGIQCEYQKGEGTCPPKPSRTKRLKAWIKRNFFNTMLTLFTAMTAVAFIFDSYITKRAYIARGTPEKRAMTILLDDTGVEVVFRNVGQTPIRQFIPQGWLLREKEIVTLEDPHPYQPEARLAAQYSFKTTLTWPDAAKDLPLLREGTIGMGILLRVYYQDVFYIWHCEDFAHHYDSGPAEGGFTLTAAPPSCETGIKRMRFNRICVPSADKTFGAWIETWEWFDSSAEISSLTPDNDRTPCQTKKDNPKQSAQTQPAK